MKCEKCSRTVGIDYSRQDKAWLCLNHYGSISGEGAISPEQGYEVDHNVCSSSMPEGLMAHSEVDVVGPSRLAAAVGVTATFGESFPCVLPGHQDEAVIRPTGRGYVQYRCMTLGESIGLGEVRAAVARQQVRLVRARDLSSAEAGIWHDRLKYEAGLILPRAVVLPMPRTRSAATLRVADGWRLLVSIRDEGAWGNFPFSFAHDFVMAWCAVTPKGARQGVAALRRCEAAILVEQPTLGSRQPILYAPPWMVEASRRALAERRAA